jgi:lysophospholipase L1-like esterase
VVVVVTTLAALGLLEGAARAWLWRVASDAQFARFASFSEIASSRQVLFARHHYLQYVTRPGYRSSVNRHDARGFRGEDVAVPKPPGVFRIALVGASTTYDSDVLDYRKSYPYRLQQLLAARQRGPIEVVNAGVHAYSSWEHLMNLQFRVLDTQPDLVVFYEALADVNNRLVYPYEAYRGDNSGSREPFSEAQESWIDRHCVGIRILRTLKGWRHAVGGRALRRTFEDVPTNYADEFEAQKLAGTYPSGIFRRVSAADMLAHNPPVYYERHLRAMAAICREFGIRFAMMTFAVSPEFTEAPRVTSPEYAAAIREHNQVLLRVCEEDRLACHDHAAEMPSDRRYWTDGRHTTEAGAELRAQLVARWLLGSGLLPPERR